MLTHVRVANGSGLVDGSAETRSVSKSRRATQEVAIGNSQCGQCHEDSTKMVARVER